MQIILGSSSPYRKRQLTDFGVTFTAESPLCDEAALKRAGPADPRRLTEFLAVAKARSLVDAHPGAFVIGSDQLVEIDGDRLDKPGSAAGARAQLARLSGRTHRLITAVALARGQDLAIETEVTEVTLRELTADEIAAYVALDDPVDCAGSYKIERAGLGLVREVQGADPGAIQGLPLIALTRAFARLGVSLTDLWRFR